MPKFLVSFRGEEDDAVVETAEHPTAAAQAMALRQYQVDNDGEQAKYDIIVTQVNEKVKRRFFVEIEMRPHCFTTQRDDKGKLIE